MRKSQVALADLDDATLSAAEERVRTGGITLGTLAEGDDDEVRRKLWQVYTLAERDVPWDRPRDGESFDRFQEMLNRPQCLHDCLVIAWDGTEIAGFTILGHARPGRATTWMTGVHPAYRNRGIALAVKARCARLARKREIEVLQTNNHVNNPAMLAVNARLGYQPLPETIVFVKRLA